MRNSYNKKCTHKAKSAFIYKGRAYTSKKVAMAMVRKTQLYFAEYYIGDTKHCTTHIAFYAKNNTIAKRKMHNIYTRNKYHSKASWTWLVDANREKVYIYKK